MRVFLSFNSKDKPIAEIVKTKLRNLEPTIDIFFSPESLGAGFWLPKLAEEIEASNAVLLLFGPAGVGPWQVMEYYEALDRRAKDPRFALVPLIVGGAVVPGLPFLRQLNWVDAPDAAADGAFARVIRFLHGDDQAVAVGGSAPARPPLWKVVQPYRGLEAMTEANADYFYGRGAETSLVLDRLASRPDRLSMLIGASGVGKSSIARAGVLSALQAMRWPDALASGDAASKPWPAAFRGSRGSWATLVIRPGAAPLRALAGAFVRLWHPDNPTDPERAALVGRWADGLKSGANSLLDLIDATQEALERRNAAPPDRILIYLDQAEELYTRGVDGAGTEAVRFAEELGTTLADPRLLAFGSLRADYFDRLQADTPLFEHYEHVNVPPMRTEQIAEVVASPARALGVAFEDERLCGRIVQAAASEPGQLPLLAYLLTDMWSAMVAQDDGRLRLPLGAIDLGGVLAARAEQFLADHPGEQPWVKRLFTLRLALVSPEGLAVRRAAPRGECDPREWALVERLADYPWRLVVARERDLARGEPVAELAHEALLKAWPRLETWLRDERDFLVFKAEVERAERRWHERDDAEGALLGALDLVAAESWQAIRGLDLSPNVREYIARSVTADRQKKERSLRFQRRVSAGFAAAAVLLLGIGAWAFSERNQALRSESEAKENARQAQIAELKADHNAQHAIDERARSNKIVSNFAIIMLNGSGGLEDFTASARKDLEDEAVSGDPGAMFIVGTIYSYGIGVLADQQKANAWFSRSADRGYSSAMIALTIKSLKGNPPDYRAARAWDEKAVGAGNTWAMMFLGWFYQNGIDVDRDYDKARLLYEQATSAGNVAALVPLGLLYQNGWGVSKDYQKAMTFFQKAADAGINAALCNIGNMYKDGLGIPVNYEQALKYYVESAASGNGDAMNNIGTIYQNGLGVPIEYARAREWYVKAAAANNVIAMNNLGYLYQNGLGVNQNFEIAMEWYDRAASNGNDVAMVNIGWLYQAGLGVEKDYHKAMDWYLKGSALKNQIAMNDVGWFYQNGWSVTRDYVKAREWYEASAALGNSVAMGNLGWLYQNGWGVPQDYVKAREWYEKGAAAGNSFAMDNLGDLYTNAWGVPQDYAKAREWYEKGAAAANSFAMNNLGYFYQNGLGTPQDYVRARDWYEKGAAAGNNAAMNNIGWLFQHGWGVPQDYAKAREWYEKGAAAGNSFAMDNLGDLYRNAWGVPQDYVKAREWYHKAAAAGNSVAMYNLGDLYRNALGVPKDPVKARDWYDKSAAAGNKQAIATLKTVGDP